MSMKEALLEPPRRNLEISPLNGYPIYDHPKDKDLYTPLNSACDVLLLLDGVVLITRDSADGEGSSVLVESPCLIGEEALFDEYYRDRAKTLCSCRVQHIPAERFNLALQNPYFAQDITLAQIRKTLALQDRIANTNLLAVQKMDALRRRIDSLKLRYPDMPSILQFSQETLGELIGDSRETANKAFRQLGLESKRKRRKP